MCIRRHEPWFHHCPSKVPPVPRRVPRWRLDRATVIQILQRMPWDALVQRGEEPSVAAMIAETAMSRMAYLTLD
jgi:hypothetical protein